MGTLCFMEASVLAHPGTVSLKHPLGSLPASRSLGLYVHIGFLLGFHMLVYFSVTYIEDLGVPE